ncbi:MAG: hypothetical protein B2I17_08885 [Thermoplasmatales archaeon B_DKE]|nr:MAG: hypothetical protein B2I17_08885 [Thermoplasmatales archaeon B_DKE]
MSDQSQNKYAELMYDIRSYLRINAANLSKETASKLLTSYEKAYVYSKMDGKTSTYKISELTGVPQRTVATWAEDFVKGGLATGPNEFFSSHRALFILTEIAIDITSLRTRDKINNGSKKGKITISENQ